MEPEPLRTEPAAATPPLSLGYAGHTPEGARPRRAAGAPTGYLLVLALGLALAGGAAGLLGDRITGGTTGLKLPHIVALLLAGSVFTWAGIVGLRYRLLQRRRHPLPPTSSRVVHAVRVLFHRSWGG